MFTFPGYLKRKKKADIEPNEIFLDKLAQKKEEELGLSRKILENPLSSRLLQGFLILSLLLIFLLFLKVLALQLFEGNELQALSEKNKFFVYSLKAARGVIYDRNLSQLVFNQPAFDLILDKKGLPETDSAKNQVLQEVSQVLKKDLKQLKTMINESDVSQIAVAENLEHQTLILLETKISELTGFRLEEATSREYKSPVFSHVLGYTGKISKKELSQEPGLYSIFDYVGKEGLEKNYESVLRKKSGELLIERDVLGNPLSKEVVSLPQSGESLVLWLDEKFQEKIAKAIKRGIKESGALKGTVVALDPNTGAVLGLVSFPFFDNNLFNKNADQAVLKDLLEDPDQPIFNRAIAGLYPVGSTIKPLVAAAALEEKLISPKKQINCQGLIEVANPYWPKVGPEFYEYHDWSVHGWTDVRKAIAESCNVFFYTIGGGYKDQKGLGPTKLKEYLNLFGWGSPTDVDLPGEKEGLIPDPFWKKAFFENPIEQVWRDGDTYNLSIGQGYIAVTPLQVATAFTAIANGGILYQPQIVQKIVALSSSPSLSAAEKLETTEIFPPKIIRENFISPETLKIVREGMRQAVTAGSATGWLDDLPVAVAAKTGTAQTNKKGYYHNWVTVFGPYEEPEIVLTVLVENVKETKVVALPIAREILQWYFSQP